VELVPADIHIGTCGATETTLNVISPFVSIPADTFWLADANCTVPEDLLFVPAEIQVGTWATILPVTIPSVSIPNETPLLFEKVTVPADLELVPADIATPPSGETTEAVTTPPVSIPNVTPLDSAKEIVPTDKLFVPADTHKGTC
jgi:hypothetical protein